MKRVLLIITPSSGGENVNVDGDEGDRLPIELSILPSHIRFYAGLRD